MVSRFAYKVFGFSVLAFVAASCGPTVSSNTASSVSEDEMSIDDFLGLLAESDEELVELGLKKGKSKGSRDQKKKAEKKARQAAVPVKKWAQASSQKKASVQAKKAASKKKNPARAAAANKPENVKKSAARKAKIKQAKLQKKIKAGNKKISAAEKKVRNLKKRKANLGSAVLAFRDVKKLPNKGLPELLAKCTAIGEAKTTLKETNSPKRPFDGSRKAFLRGLERQRDTALKVNGVKSCGAARKLAASLPAEPWDPADEVIDEVDQIDEVPLEIADAEDFEVVEAELEAELEAEEEMAAEEMALADEAAAEEDAGADAGGPVAGGDGSGCVILEANGAALYTSLTATEAACNTTCTALEPSNPYRSCSFNGTVFREVPLKNCVITAADGSLLVNMKSIPRDCRVKCSSFAATHPGKSCSWDGNVMNPD